jgi:peptidoglycan/LPS O-acetylase OafA/YrhL
LFLEIDGGQRLLIPSYTHSRAPTTFLPTFSRNAAPNSSLSQETLRLNNYCLLALIDLPIYIYFLIVEQLSRTITSVSPLAKIKMSTRSRDDTSYYDTDETLGLLETYQNDSTGFDDTTVQEKDNEPVHFDIVHPTHESTLKIVPSIDEDIVVEHPKKIHIEARAYKYLIAVLPSYALGFIGHEVKRKKLHPTAWLDGLRGVAALCVVITHSILIWRLDLFQIQEGHRLSFIEWPIIRLLFSGGAMVSLFFIISGYALSYRPLKLIQAREQKALLPSLASSVLRRWMRLYIPTFVSLFCSFLLTISNMYSRPGGGREPPRYSTTWGQFCGWVQVLQNYSDIFKNVEFDNNGPVYDTNLWTIPIEFQGSAIVFLTLAGLSQTKDSVRLVLIILLDAWAFYRAYLHITLFLTGMLLAELGLRRSRIQVDEHKPFVNVQREYETIPHSVESHNLLWKAPACLGFVISLVLLSFPFNDLRPDSMYTWLRERAPRFWQVLGPEWFYLAIGSILCVSIIDRSKLLQGIFCTRLAQYLGYISFSIYAVHGPFLFSFGMRIMARFLDLIGTETVIQALLAYSAGALVIFFALIWIADIFTRCVDEPSVRWAKWFCEKCNRQVT